MQATQRSISIADVLPARANRAWPALALLALIGCHKSSNAPAPPVQPTTNNLTAGSIRIATEQPRVGYPLEVLTTIQAVEDTADVSVSFFALNGEDVAREQEQVRQFYLGTVTFPLVQTTITEYRAQLTVPASVTPPGDYLILCSLDPSDLLKETNEDDNLAELPTTLVPMADPNVYLQELTLDSPSLLLDPDQDDVAGSSTGDVQNSDAGATLVVGLEGTLAPVDVEAFVKLRITRTDLPPGQDVHDVPLYLWDSDAQRYIDAYGINGPVEWLTLRDLVPEQAAETDATVDVTSVDLKSVHLDVYLPGKLSSVMIAILEHLVSGPPPTVPPPDLTLAAIQELQAFFAGASLSKLQYSIVVEVRGAGGFADSDPNDNAAAQPLFIVLPGRESYAPDRPIALAQGLDAEWQSDLFGVRFDFDSFASLDARGAVAEVRGSVPIRVFGSTLDFMRFDARAQVVPAIDAAAIPAGENSGFSLELEFASVTVYSYDAQLGYVFDGSFSVSKEKSYSKTFFVGPVPLSATGGVAGEVGYELLANLQPTSLASRAGPYATLEAKVEASVGIAGVLSGGAGGSLTLIDERFIGSVQTGLAVVSPGPPAAIFEGSVAMRVTNTVTGPTGRLYLFVEFPGLKWCRVCPFGLCFSVPCGFKTVRKELSLVTWQSFVKEDVLFDETLCKRVRIQGGTTFTSCGPL